VAAGNLTFQHFLDDQIFWIPAFAGMTAVATKITAVATKIIAVATKMKDGICWLF